MTVGENIRKFRKERKLTQKQLGDRCGIDEANIRKYENGKQNPKLETTRKIASALDVYISDLVDDWNKFPYEEIAEDWKQNEQPFEELTTLVEKGKKDTICNLLDLMNTEGQNKAVEQVELLTKIPAYRKED